MDGLTRDVRIALVISAIGLYGVVAYSVLQRIKSLLYGIGPSDPRVFMTVSLALLLVAGFAALVPARRASRIEPVKVLRVE